MFVNLIAKNIDILHLDDIVVGCLFLCSEIVFHLKYNKILIKIKKDYIVSILPPELTHIKKFVRKITYILEDKTLVFYPVNNEIEKIIIFK